jgi:hypothetical protein
MVECTPPTSARIARMTSMLPVKRLVDNALRDLEEGHLIVGGCSGSGVDPAWQCAPRRTPVHVISHENTNNWGREILPRA